ncbi:hypothetical protein [Arthrobacter sp. MI7-26]|uniref:hypothetical protein n=1 Tax=Arthrobacter sp. MI7-26 TaxID=2993653 RepID=UPI002248B955|nr:hypothetical protein [Arthrobacter sp. MI7-26]
MNRMIAVSLGSVTTASKSVDFPASAWPRVSVPSTDEGAAGSAMIMKNCSTGLPSALVRS